MKHREKLGNHLRETETLRSVAALLGWDQQTYMPQGAADLRASQLSLLAGLVHRRRSAPELGDRIAAAEEEARALDSGSAEAADLRWVRREFERAIRVPADLMAERAAVTAQARQAWVAARRENDFPSFRPWLERILGIERRRAEALGYEDHPYDALLDEYEPKETRAHLQALFGPLREKLVDLLGRIRGSGRTVESAFLRGSFPAGRQAVLARRFVEAIGFDFDHGRIDTTVHPFCGGTGPCDVRLTTRYPEHELSDGLFSALHEAGHGLYEQGLAPDRFGWPSGRACSLGMHESQSRLWENQVGRSAGFWRRHLPWAREAFPGALRGVDAEGFRCAVNKVAPSLIRVEADEVTYNLHIFMRFELEQALLTGDLPPSELPGAWNDASQDLLGIRPENDSEGCLQDVHWSAGLLGYFPTYSLGNLYGAQLFAAAGKELGDLDEAFARGEFAPLLDWLRREIHLHGRRYAPKELVERATGAPPDPGALLEYLETKYGGIYGL